jgi:hypothetical protein
MSDIGKVSDHDFMGRNGFYWWVGVVEDVNDPLRLGRARVRIFGVHHESVDVLPTDQLPWATALAPLSASTSPKSPPHASWVLGFFLDGRLAQQPVMLGVFCGLRSQTPEANPFTDTVLNTLPR